MFKNQDELPQYTCDMDVGALQIDKVKGHMLHFREDGYGEVKAPADWIDAQQPEAGGYLVVDGNEAAYVPGKEFESNFISDDGDNDE